MKKLLQIFLFIICLFTFSGCQNELEVNIENAIVGIDITYRFEDNGQSWQDKSYWTIKYFANPEVFDLSTANRVQIKTYIPKYDNYGDTHTYSEKFTGVIPDDVAPTEANNYFVVEIDAKKYDPSREYSYSVGEEPNYYTDAEGIKHYYPSEHLIILDCFAYVLAEPGSEMTPNTIPSIFNTILFGIGMIVVGVVLYWIATVLIRNKISLVIAFLLPVIMTLGSFIVWDFIRGIIMSVCFVIYYIAITLMVKYIDDQW